MYLDMHGLIFEMTTSIRQDQSDICTEVQNIFKDMVKWRPKSAFNHRLMKTEVDIVSHIITWNWRFKIWHIKVTSLFLHYIQKYINKLFSFKLMASINLDERANSTYVCHALISQVTSSKPIQHALQRLFQRAPEKRSQSEYECGHINHKE